MRFDSKWMAVFLLAAPVRAQIPRQIPVQGVLKTSGGPPVQGGTAVKLSLYDVPTGGTALWTETKGVPVTAGAFSTVLGDHANLSLPFDKPYWVGVAINGEAVEMTPRIALGAVPYSLNSALALPFLESGAMNGAAFSIVNNAPGVAISGQSAVTGVLGSITSTAPGSSGVQGVNADGRDYGSLGLPGIGAQAYDLRLDDTTGIGLAAYSYLGSAISANSGQSGTSVVIANPAYGVKATIQHGTGMFASVGVGTGVDAEVSSGVGVHGFSSSSTGVYGESDTQDGVEGFSKSASFRGVYGQSNGVNGTGVEGYAFSNSGTGRGVYGGTNAPQGVGVYGQGGVTGVVGVTSVQNGTGVSGSADQGSSAIGVYGSSISGFAGYFSGTAAVTGSLFVGGSLTKAGGSFKIDDPIDPANKYLSHSFVESPDMKNIYDGVAVLDADGGITVTLPDWFGALNRDFRYQLTAIGAPGPNLYIAEKVTNNSFRIAGGVPGMEVSWQVTGIRQDAWANAHRIPVEEPKAAAERGKYLHPVEQGLPANLTVEAATAGMAGTK